MTTRATHETLQQQHTTELRKSTQDRPAHAAYLDTLLSLRPGDDPHQVPVPEDVSARYAQAILDDVDWCRTPLPNPAHPYPDAYATLRRRDKAAATRRAQNQRNRLGLADLLPAPTED